jgi:transcriptional regulator of acetoin/glycerol metabolism
MHSTSPHQHIATVMQVATDGAGALAAAGHEQVISDSWLRCVQQHRLDPTRMQEAVILLARSCRCAASRATPWP